MRALEHRYTDCGELSILTDDRIMTDCQFRSLKFGVVPQMLGAPFGSAPSIITSVHSPWQRMASARQFASRIAKSLDRNGVILHSGSAAFQSSHRYQRRHAFYARR